jgi:hypothetical protein
VVSKSNGDGSVRYFAVYADTAGVHLYHKVAGSAVANRVSWAVRLDDNAYHRVTVSVQQASASLFVDGVHIGARPRTLLGVVENCDVPSVDCRLVTGARASSNAEYAFPWTGKLGDVTVYAGTFLTFDPLVAVPLPAVGALPVDAVSTFPYFDLMATSRHVYHGSVNVVTGLFSLNGLNASVELASHDFVPGPDFSLAFSLRVTPNAAGYVYAKGDPSGRRPYVAVEYNPTSATRGQSTVFKN